MPDSSKVALALSELKALREKVDAVADLVAGDPRLAVELARLRLSAALMQRWTENRLAELELVPA